MRQPKFFFFVQFAALAFLLSTGFASAGDWAVQQVSGQVSVSSGTADPIPVTTATVIRSGDTVSTAKESRVHLIQGRDSVIVGPSTVLSVPLAPAPGLLTTLVQKAGKIELEIEKQAQPHFSVETPYLAAIVKGTHFTVEVAEDQAQVVVERGQVDVRNLKSGKVASVKGGFRATVTSVSNAIVTGVADLVNFGVKNIPRALDRAFQNRPGQRAIAALQRAFKSLR